MLALGQAGRGAGRGDSRIDHFRVTGGGDGLLRNENVVADGAMLALGQTGLGAGCSLRSIDHFRVAFGSYRFQSGSMAIFTLLFVRAAFRAGCRSPTLNIFPHMRAGIHRESGNSSHHNQHQSDA